MNVLKQERSDLSCIECVDGDTACLRDLVNEQATDERSVHEYRVLSQATLITQIVQIPVDEGFNFRLWVKGCIQVVSPWLAHRQSERRYYLCRIGKDEQAIRRT